MTENKASNQAKNKPQETPKPASSQKRNVLINAQYIKDISFENPGAPASLVPSSESPKIDVAIDVQVNHMQKNTYEVVLLISADAKLADKSLFLIELSYGSVFTVEVPEQELEPVLMIYCPGMIFPFARRIISDSVRDGGFPPLMLDPIDFASLFQQYKTKLAASVPVKKAK